MAELAAGAVQSLLGVIRNEARLRGRVESDVQFIKEEMESMNSFLLHLSRTVPPGGEHSEQVRTWMKQVRELASACSNGIDDYVQRGDPSVHLHRVRSPLGYLRWVHWYLQRYFAQRSAAIKLHKLKDRARDVGERRFRYGVEIPKTPDDTTMTRSPITGAPTSSSQAAGVGGDDEEDDQPVPEIEASARAEAFAETSIKKECTNELIRWLHQDRHEDETKNKLAAIAIVVPEEKGEKVGAEIALDALTEFPWNKSWISFTDSEDETDPSRREEDAERKQGPGLPVGPLDILQKIMNIAVHPEDNSAKKKKKTKEIQVEEIQVEEILELKEEKMTEIQVQVPKMEEIDEKIRKIEKKMGEYLPTIMSSLVPPEPLDILLHLIQELSVKDKDATEISGKNYDRMDKITETAKKIKEHMDVGLDLPETVYVSILKKKLTEEEDNNKPIKENTGKSGDDDDQITNNIRGIMNKIKSGEDQIEENIKETTEKIMVNKLRELLLKPKEADHKLGATDKLGEEVHIQQIKKKIDGVLQSIKEQLLPKIMAEMIKEHLAGKRTIIILEGVDYVDKWEETETFFSSLGFAPGSAVVVITKYPQGSKQFCNTAREPIVCSLAASYYYKVLKVTGASRNRKYRDVINYNTNIFRDILEHCEPHKFCMKIFLGAMYAKPNRSKEELDKLLGNLVFRGSEGTNAKTLVKFSYRDLPRDYKTCFLYLAIFPSREVDPNHKINRSRLIGRWLVEGLITKQDWPDSVRHAVQCFDALVDRRLVHPVDIGATGKVKSCTVHKLVHDVITKIAKEEHFMDTRLSHHLAKHFSILSDIRLRSSDTMEKFLKGLYKSLQMPLVRVLDLEGCEGINDTKFHYLKDICNRMLLLKYLSLRNTKITNLPDEINNLQQLEVLDIRQTGVRPSATKDVLLVKLKRLLAGDHTDRLMTPVVSSVCNIPRRIMDMTSMEVLCNVETSPSGAELKHIGGLWQLRKFGVVINKNYSTGCLNKFVAAISDLNECLRSLSIALPDNTNLPDDIFKSLKEPPKYLESLSISGRTRTGELLPLLIKGADPNPSRKAGSPAFTSQLAKVTLCRALLSQDNMKNLANLPNLRCLRLGREAYTEKHLTFEGSNVEFKKLKYLLVEGSNMAIIDFQVGATPELEKIVLSSTEVKSLLGIKHICKLQELDIYGDCALKISNVERQLQEIAAEGSDRMRTVPVLNRHPPRNQGQVPASAAAAAP